MLWMTLHLIRDRCKILVVTYTRVDDDATLIMLVACKCLLNLENTLLICNLNFA